MGIYIGTKLIKALAMTRLQYNEYRGWDLPGDENGDDAGFLVEYMDGGKANHPGHEGYISWSPADVFERAYRPTENMSFGLALEALKMGKAVARSGWNGKNQFVFLIKGTQYQDSLGCGFGEYYGEPKICSGLAIKTTANEIQVGWLASQSDMLSDDWCIID